MPIYEYECLEKGHRFEVLQKISEEPIQVCQECGGKVRKLVSAAGFMLKGSGWYKDGYSKPQVSSKDTPASTESKPAETKKAESSVKKTESSATPTPNNKETKS